MDINENMKYSIHTSRLPFDRAKMQKRVQEVAKTFTPVWDLSYHIMYYNLGFQCKTPLLHVHVTHTLANTTSLNILKVIGENGMGPVFNGQVFYLLFRTLLKYTLFYSSFAI